MMMSYLELVFNPTWKRVTKTILIIYADTIVKMNMDHELGSVFKICASGSGKVHKKVKQSIEERYQVYKSQFQVETPVEEVQEVQDEATDAVVEAPVTKKKIVVDTSNRMKTSNQYQTNARMSTKERSDLKKNKKKMTKTEL